MAQYLQRLPLYHSEQHETQIELADPGINKGLLFDRWFGGYAPDWKVDKLQKDSDNNTHPLAWLEGPCGDKDRLEQARERQLALCLALDGQAISCDLDWHMVTGTGEAHPLENGFRWHHTLSVPYLPASSIKGMLRAWLSAWASDTFTAQELTLLFGNEPEAAEASMGQLQFFDALPVSPPILSLDVMTPHGGDWYMKGGSEPGKPNTVPADWQSPVPITFLVVKKAHFLFTLAARNEAAKALLPKVMAALADALSILGIGAKTALGYGVMTKRADADKGSGERLLKEFADLRQARQAAQQRQLALASMSDNQRLVAALKDKLQRQSTEQQKQSLNAEVETLVEQAIAAGWSRVECDSLIDMVEQDSAWLKVADKKKLRPRKEKLAGLKE